MENIIQSMKVPLAYGPRDKFLVRLTDDADLVKLLQLHYHELVLRLITFLMILLVN